MSITDKDFKVKNGLNVAGTATFESDIVLSSIPLAYDTGYKRLKIFIDGEWLLIPTSGDLVGSIIDGGNPSSTYSSITVLDGGNV